MALRITIIKPSANIIANKRKTKKPPRGHIAKILREQTLTALHNVASAASAASVASE